MRKSLARAHFVCLKLIALFKFLLNDFIFRARRHKTLKIEVRTDFSRYLINLIQFFTMEGYSVKIVPNRPFVGILNRYWFALAKNKWVSLAFSPGKSTICISDRDNPSGGIKLNKDYYGDGPHLADHPYYKFPFTLHPSFYLRPAALHAGPYPLQANRKFKLVFVGNLAATYQDITLGVRILLSRTKLMDLLVQNFADLVHLPTSESEIYDTDKPICIIDTKQFRLDKTAYLTFLASSTHALCPPGMKMPLCHNLIECIYVGCIPVLQYGYLLNPALPASSPFVESNDFIEKVKDVLSETRDTRAEAEVLQRYYLEHLTPAAVVRKFEELSAQEGSELFMLAGDAGGISMALAQVKS